MFIAYIELLLFTLLIILQILYLFATFNLKIWKKIGKFGDLQTEHPKEQKTNKKTDERLLGIKKRKSEIIFVLVIANVATLLFLILTTENSSNFRNYMGIYVIAILSGYLYLYFSYTFCIVEEVIIKCKNNEKKQK